MMDKVCIVTVDVYEGWGYGIDLKMVGIFPTKEIAEQMIVGTEYEDYMKRGELWFDEFPTGKVVGELIVSYRD